MKDFTELIQTAISNQTSVDINITIDGFESYNTVKILSFKDLGHSITVITDSAEYHILDLSYRKFFENDDTEIFTYDFMKATVSFTFHK